MQRLLARLQQLVDEPFGRITYTEAIALLQKPENVSARDATILDDNVVD